MEPDLEALTAWLHGRVELQGPLRAKLIAGGRSNLTYRITDGRTTWALRRPPLGHVLASAHDMQREYRVMHALRATDVPVPTVLGEETTDTVLGAPFYIMQYVPGRPYRRAAELAALGAARSTALSERLIDNLVRLHAVEPASVGLADLGRPEGFLARQVRTWKRQLDASHSRPLPLAARDQHRDPAFASARACARSTALLVRRGVRCGLEGSGSCRTCPMAR